MKIQLWYQSDIGLEGPMVATLRHMVPGDLGSRGRQIALIKTSATLKGGLSGFYCEKMPRDRHLSIGDYAWELVFPFGYNFDKPEHTLLHVELKKVDDSDPFSVWCPVCEGGKLSIRKVVVSPKLSYLSRRDECSHCMQRVVYQDDSIGSHNFMPNRTRFERGDSV